MSDLTLREGKMTSREIAEWMGIKPKTYSSHL
jgi:DNA-binding CsgD family transcriptional regulator